MRRAALSLVCMVATLAWPSASSAGDTPWTRCAIEGHPVSVEMPGAPRSERQTSSWGPFGTAETTGILWTEADAELAARATVAPSWAIKGAGNGLIFTTTKDSVLRSRSAKVVSWEPVTRDGLDGRRLQYALRSDPSRVGVMEVFVADPYILTFDVLAPKGTQPVQFERFFRSIDLTR